MTKKDKKLLDLKINFNTIVMRELGLGYNDDGYIFKYPENESDFAELLQIKEKFIKYSEDQYPMIAHNEIDLKNPKANAGNAGFSDQERGKIDVLLKSGFTDTFRFMYPDAVGRYSWWSYRFNARKNNAGWRIDYFIVSDRIRDKIRNADILSDIYGSDHCPVLLDIDI